MNCHYILDGILQNLQNLIAAPTVSSSDLEQHQAPFSLVHSLYQKLSKMGYVCLVFSAYHNQTVDLLAIPQSIFKKLQKGEARALSNSVLLSGHMDVVPFNEKKWHSHPQEMYIKDDKVYGRGSVDMKGYLAVCLSVVQNLLEKYTDNSKLPCLLFTSDEETSMDGAALIQSLFSSNPCKVSLIDKLRIVCSDSEELIPLFNEASCATSSQDYQVEGRLLSVLQLKQMFSQQAFKLVIIGEPTNMDVVYRHKGWMALEIQLKGKGGHSSQVDVGVNVLPTIAKAIDVIEHFYYDMVLDKTKHLCKCDRPTLNLGTISGGTALNCICDKVTLGFDFRPTVEFDVEAFDRYFEDYLQHHLCLPDGVTLSFRHIYESVAPFMNKSPESIKLIKKYAPESEMISVCYCTEAPFLSTFGPTVVMGPGSIKQAHTDNEYIEIAELSKCFNFLKDLIIKG